MYIVIHRSLKVLCLLSSVVYSSQPKIKNEKNSLVETVCTLLLINTASSFSMYYIDRLPSQVLLKFSFHFKLVFLLSFPPGFSPIPRYTMSRPLLTYILYVHVSSLILSNLAVSVLATTCSFRVNCFHIWFSRKLRPRRSFKSYLIII